MFAVITPEKIQLPPGAVVKLPGNWQDYKALSQQLGDRSESLTNGIQAPRSENCDKN